MNYVTTLSCIICFCLCELKHSLSLDEFVAFDTIRSILSQKDLEDLRKVYEALVEGEKKEEGKSV